MTEKCPFCYSEVKDSDNICPSCQNSLDVECPYCKQQIKAYDTKCPFCTTTLKKSDYSKVLTILATILSIAWCTTQVLLLTIFTYYPQVFEVKDGPRQDFMVADYEKLCMYGMVIPFILFIILAVGKSKFKNYAIIGIAINALLFIIFSMYALYLKFHFN